MSAAGLGVHEAVPAPATATPPSVLLLEAGYGEQVLILEPEPVSIAGDVPEHHAAGEQEGGARGKQPSGKRNPLGPVAGCIPPKVVTVFCLGPSAGWVAGLRGEGLPTRWVCRAAGRGSVAGI